MIKICDIILARGQLIWSCLRRISMNKAVLQELSEEENSVSLDIQYMGLNEPVKCDKMSSYRKKSANIYSSLGDAQERHMFDI